MPKPTRIGHLVINAKDLDAATKFYTDVIGFDIALERPGFGTFLTAGVLHHDLAIFQAPEGAADTADGDVGLNHMAIEVADFEELTEYYHKLQSYFEDTELRTTDHGMTRRSEEHTSELQSLVNLVCRLLLEKKNKETTK